MSWERTKYEARCTSCGKTGFVIKAEDDWFRSSVTWIGFENSTPSPTSVSKKKMDSRESTPLCECGNTSVEVGEMLGPCDYKGELYKQTGSESTP